MTVSEAKSIAQNHVDNMGEVFTGFKFGIENPVDFRDRFAFDFIFLTLDGKQPKEPPVAGGARGLTIDKKTAEVTLVSHGVYSSLVIRERELNETYDLINNLKRDKKDLSFIKNKYNLNSKQLLDFSKALEDKELSKETIYQLIAQLIDGVKNNP